MSVSVRNEDGVSIITIDRPDAANAINADVGEGIAAAIAAASADRHTLGAVLTGAGERVFSAGADLKNPANLPPPDLAARRSATLHTLLDAVLGFPKPLVAALNGAAVGAGAMVALLCDRVVCVPTGRFSLPEIDVGMPHSARTGHPDRPRGQRRRRGLGPVRAPNAGRRGRGERAASLRGRWRVAFRRHCRRHRTRSQASARFRAEQGVAATPPPRRNRGGHGGLTGIPSTPRRRGRLSMDVELSSELREFRQAVRRFVSTRLEPIARRMDETDEAPPELSCVLRDGGYLGMRLDRGAWRRRHRPVSLLPDARGAEPQPSLLHLGCRLLDGADAVRHRTARNGGAEGPLSPFARDRGDPRRLRPERARSRVRPGGHAHQGASGARRLADRGAQASTSAAAAAPISSC